MPAVAVSVSWHIMQLRSKRGLTKWSNVAVSAPAVGAASREPERVDQKRRAAAANARIPRVFRPRRCWKKSMKCQPTRLAYQRMRAVFPGRDWWAGAYSERGPILNNRVSLAAAGGPDADI